MRILLAAGDDPREAQMQRLLEGAGHEVIREAARGEELVTSVGAIGHLHAAAVSQGSLGRKWPRLLRQFRKQASHVPVVYFRKARRPDVRGGKP